MSSLYKFFTVSKVDKSFIDKIHFLVQILRVTDFVGSLKNISYCYLFDITGILWYWLVLNLFKTRTIRLYLTQHAGCQQWHSHAQLLHAFNYQKKKVPDYPLPDYPLPDYPFTDHQISEIAEFVKQLPSLYNKPDKKWYLVVLH